MTTPTEQPRKATARDLFFFTNPQHWATWPFLPVVRRHADGSMDYGVLYDALHATGQTGFSAQVSGVASLVMSALGLAYLLDLMRSASSLFGRDANP